MTPDPRIQKATGDIGGFILTAYRDKSGALHAANAVNALGAWAGVFAQVQARAKLITGAWPPTESALVEVKTKDGGRYFFGDAINACLMEGDARSPSFWKFVGAIVGAEAAAQIDVIEIARRAASDVGGPSFGKPRIDARYKLNEAPIDAVRRHGPAIARRLQEIGFPSTDLMVVFGSVAQSFARFAAGQVKDVTVKTPMNGEDIVRLYMEAAIPMSKLDLASVGLGR